MKPNWKQACIPNDRVNSNLTLQVGVKCMLYMGETKLDVSMHSCDHVNLSQPNHGMLNDMHETNRKQACIQVM
jgi:hypothetical protein